VSTWAAAARYLVFRHDPSVQAPTEIYVPNLQYPGGYQVEVSDGEARIDRDAQMVEYHHSPEEEIHRIVIGPVS
jgi:hypothetical protein